jgi:hypothetical protein
MEAKK